MEGLNFRFSTSEDEILYHNSLLNSPEDCEKEDERGWNEDFIERNTWRVTLTATLGTRVVGFLKMIGGSSTGFSYLQTVYIFPQYRKRGIGRELVKYAEDYMKRTWNGVGVELFTLDNKPMDTLIESEHWIKDGVALKRYFRNGRFIPETRWIKLY